MNSNSRKIFTGITILLIILVSSTGRLEAQDAEDIPKMRVVEVERALDGEIISRSNVENYDANGKLAAGIIVQSDIPDLTFQSRNDIIRQINPAAGEWRLLVSEDEGLLEVYSTEFIEPLSVVLRDEGVELESGKFWIIRITGERAITERSVTIRTSETDASLSISGESVERTPNNLYLLGDGEYIFQITKKGFNPILDTVNIDVNNVFFEYDMERTSRINITFRSIPGDASAIVDGTPEAGLIPENRPYNTVVFPGEHEIEIRKPGYVDFKEIIFVSSAANADNNFVFNLQKNTGYVIASSNTEGASLFVDDQEYPLTEIAEIPPRTVPYNVEIRSEGYDPYQEVLEIGVGDTLRIEADLELIVGDLTVKVQPNEANWQLLKDDEIILSNTGTMFLPDVAAGSYMMRATLDNYIPQFKPVVIQRDQETQASLILLPEEGIGRLSITGLSGSKASLSGAGSYGFGSDQVADIPRLEFGQYDMVVKTPGFKKIRRSFDFRQQEETIDLLQYYEPKRKFGAATWTLIFPGGGHFHMGRKLGWLYFFAGSALMYLSYDAITTSNSNWDDFQTKLKFYKQLNNTSTETPAQYWDETVKPAIDIYNTSIKDRDLYAYALIGLKGLEIIDYIIFTRSPIRQLNKAKRIAIDTKGTQVSMSYNF